MTRKRRAIGERPGGRIWLAAALACLSVLLLTSAADARGKARGAKQELTSIVIDADTGSVISEFKADASHYPASLTKMMTLYLIFEALEKHRIRPETEFTVSAHAAGMSPTKLGLQPGETIAVRDIILGLVTQSANDAAVVAAEGLAGSEELFAQRMNAKAHALGMSRTEFYNASGLPDPRQVTTARDLARLARALYRDFPGQYRNFATQEFMFRGAVYTNHNHLMERFAGMDGIKTGYIRASGFNLAASAVRNNQRLIGVVMGGESSRARDDKMAALLNAGFGQSAEDPIAALADATDAMEARSFSDRARQALRHLSPVSSAEAAVPQVRKPTHASHSGQTDGDAWGIQVGAFAQRAGATRAAQEALGALPWAKGKTIAVQAPGAGEKSRLYRARIVGFTEKDADRACQTLHRKRAACNVVGPGTLSVAQR